MLKSFTHNTIEVLGCDRRGRHPNEDTHRGGLFVVDKIDQLNRIDQTLWTIGGKSRQVQNGGDPGHQAIGNWVGQV